MAKKKKQIRGLAITDITTIEQYNKVCEVVGDKVSTYFNQRRLEQLFENGQTIMYDLENRADEFMHFWHSRDDTKQLRHLTYQEFLYEFVEPTIDISGV